MKTRSVFFSIMITAMIVLVVGVVVLADSRINQAHHFGGDALYCDANIGCWMLDSNGTQLWDVPQSTLDTTMTTACETGQSQVIEIGAGTYGLFWLEVSCYEGMDSYFTLVGYDEYGKINRMRFAPDYTPVFGAPISTPTPIPTPTMIPIVTPL